MFRIVCFCDDKKLAYVLWALTGHIHGSPEIIPVINAKKSGGKIKQATNGKLIDMFADHIKNRPEHMINARFVKDFLEKIGNSPKSSGYVLKQAAAAKIIRKLGKGAHSRYVILKPKE
jgi:hypothetical protein